MDKCSSDAEFDSYWEFEAKNKNRNRIRVGRQYQATIPPLLKPGEKDARKCEDLETLKWRPDQISEQDIDAYLSMAKAVSSFARTIENCRSPEKPPENSLQTAIKGLTEFVTSHHPCHRDAGCKVPVSESSSPSEASSSKSNVVCDWTPPETRLFIQALETCGKNFCAIKKEFLPWKPVRSLIEYYYYFNGKGDKSEGAASKPSSPVNELPVDGSICKVEKTEPEENCCQEVDMAVNPDTKEEQSMPEVVKADSELQATSTAASEEEKLAQSKESSLPQSVDHESTLVQSTVGSLKFFLGGKLVLKLNAQQEPSSGTKCQWVQSQDVPRFGHQSKKMRHRKKSIQDTLPQVSTSPKVKKKQHEEDPSVNSENSTNKKLKLKTPYVEAFPLLCSSSWTPPIADGREAAELDDASSKTSEGQDSPLVLASRGFKQEGLVEVKRLDCVPPDLQDSKLDKKLHWPLTEPVPSTSSDIYDEYSSHGSSFTSEKISPDISYSHEVLNPKSALTPAKSQAKGSQQPRAAHSGSPNAKLFAKWPCPTLDAEKPKDLPFFHSPNSLCCHPSPESTSRDFVLDLSSKSGYCKAQDSKVSPELCCSIYPNECLENCSSSEESAHNDSSPCCASKSSNFVAYRKDTPVPGTETSKSDQKSLTQSSRDSEYDENQVSRTASDGGNDCAGQCLCCYDPSTSCASPKCCKSYSSKEHVCNKEDCNPDDSPNSMLMPSGTDAYATKQQQWYGTSVTPFIQIYPQCYPYYVTYDINQPINSNAAAVETPLDLSNSEPEKNDNSLSNALPEIGVDVPANATETMDRGMLYQLLKNKVNK